MDPGTLCAICGRLANHEHHESGRGPDGSQLDPHLTAPVCHEDHDLLHDDLRTAGIDRPLQATSVPERIERRLERVGLFLGRVAEAFPPFRWIGAIASACSRWAAELGSFVASLDRCCPGWRQAPGTA